MKNKTDEKKDLTDSSVGPIESTQLIGHYLVRRYKKIFSIPNHGKNYMTIFSTLTS